MERRGEGPPGSSQRPGREAYSVIAFQGALGPHWLESLRCLCTQEDKELGDKLDHGSLSCLTEGSCPKEQGTNSPTSSSEVEQVRSRRRPWGLTVVTEQGRRGLDPQSTRNPEELD